MKNLYVALCFTFCVIGIDTFSAATLSYFGQNRTLKLSLLISLREPGRGRQPCGQILESQLQVLAAVQWAVTRVNEKYFLFNDTLGYDMYDDCDSDWYTIEGLQTFYGCQLSPSSGRCEQQHSIFDIGLVVVSRAIQRLSLADILKHVQKPVITPYDVPDDLPNIRSNGPSLREQALHFVRLIKDLGWTYATAVYSNDPHGRTGVELIKKLAGNQDICVEIIGNITSMYNKSVSDIVGKVLDAARDSSADTVGVIYFGRGFPGKLFVKELTVKSKNKNTKVQSILSEDMEEWLMELRKFPGVPEDTFVFRQNYPVVKDFEVFYNNSVSNNISTTSYFRLESLVRQFEKSNGRRPRPISDATRNALVSSVLDAVFSLTVAYRTTKCGVMQTCSQYRNITSEQLITQVKGNSARYGPFGGFIPPEFMNTNNSNSSTLDLYLIRNDTNAGILKINVTDSDDPTWDVRRLEKNSPSTGIGTCIASYPYPYVYLDGEVLILGLFSAHGVNNDDPFGCGEDSSTEVAILPEVFLYGVEAARNRTGINFGAVVFGVCQSIARATVIVSRFMSKELQITKPGSKNKIDPDRVVVVIGPYFSGTTLPIALFFNALSIPVVGYSASTPALDDRNSFPYFLRTVPSDKTQAEAMVKIVKRMGWQYVSILYVDNSYGLGGKESFMTAAQREGICVIEPALPLSEEGSERENRDVLTLLQKQSRKVVVLFAIENRTVSLLKTLHALHNRIDVNKFIFLASEDWGDSPRIIQIGQEQTLGSITLKLGIAKISDQNFTKYISNRVPSSKIYNPWFQQVWADYFKCSPDATFNYSKRCAENLTFPGSIVAEWQNNERVVSVLSAVHAVSDGLRRVASDICPNVDASKCHKYRKHPEKMVAAMKNSTVFSCGSQRIFDDNGNGRIGFDVFSVDKKNTGNISYLKVGSYENGILQLSTELLKLDYITAACTAEICGQCSADNARQSTRHEGSSADIGTQRIDIVILVLVVLIFCLLIFKLVCDFRSKQLRRGKRSDDNQLTNLNPGQTYMYADDSIRSCTRERLPSVPNEARYHTTSRTSSDKYLTPAEATVNSHIYDLTAHD